jgi:hypothetical protein
LLLRNKLLRNGYGRLFQSFILTGTIEVQHKVDCFSCNLQGRAVAQVPQPFESGFGFIPRGFKAGLLDSQEGPITKQLYRSVKAEDVINGFLESINRLASKE